MWSSDATWKPGIKSTSSPKTKSKWRSSSSNAGVSLRSSKPRESRHGLLEEPRMQCPGLPTVQGHRRAAYEQVEITIALAARRTAAHMTCRFRDKQNHVDADFCHQQQRLKIRNYFRPSPITRNTATHSGSRSYSKNDTGDARNAQRHFELRCELQLHRLHSESQSDEFEHSQESAQFKNQNVETRTANVSIAPEFTCLRVRDSQLVTEVSTLRKQETELQIQLQKHK